jgi:hypothetical protein
VFRKRAASRGTPWWWPKSADPQLSRDAARMNAELMPWSLTARLVLRATDRRLERLRAEEELQRRLEALGTPDPRGGTSGGDEK